MSFPERHCTGTGTEPLESLGQGLGKTPGAGSLWRGVWRQEAPRLPGRGRTQHRGTQENRCRADAKRPSAGGEPEWAVGARLLQRNQRKHQLEGKVY